MTEFGYGALAGLALPLAALVGAILGIISLRKSKSDLEGRVSELSRQRNHLIREIQKLPTQPGDLLIYPSRLRIEKNDRWGWVVRGVPQREWMSFRVDPKHGEGVTNVSS